MPVPRFWERIEYMYKNGLAQQFLLHFNVDDFIWDDVYGYLPTTDFFMERMNWLGCNAIISYSRSEGITFPNLSLRDQYQSAMKLARIDEVEPLPEDLPPVKRLNVDFKDVGKEKLIRETEEALLTLERFFRQGMGNLKVGLIIKDVEKLAPNRNLLRVPDQSMEKSLIDLETLKRWTSDMQIRLRNHMILFLTENTANVSPELTISDASTVFPVMIPLPTYEERLAYIRHLLNLPEDAENENKFKLDLPEGTLSEDFAKMTHGLTLKDIQALWLLSKRRETTVSLNMVVRRNMRSVRARSYGRLELIFGEHGLNTMGGLKTVIPYMTGVMQAMKSNDPKRVPMGILMVGPPGTGKTSLIQAMGRDLGFHFVKLRDIRGNDTEERSAWDLRRALDTIRTLAPVVVFIDEIDKIGRTFADERERKIMNQLLEELVTFMGDPALRGSVLWIAASNRPDLIRPEFRKRGRFDDVIPFLPPDPEERIDILKKMFSKNAIPYDNRINFSIPVQNTDRCTGADLEVIAMRSYQNARLGNKDTVVEQDVVKAASEFVPDYDPDMHEYMMLLAIREANISSLVPANLGSTLQDRVYENKRISKARINARIRELEILLNPRRSILTS